MREERLNDKFVAGKTTCKERPESVSGISDRLGKKQMHQPVIENLEAYLEGRHVPELESHLRSCTECQSILAVMSEHSQMLQTLRVDEELAPFSGFYTRVMMRIETESKPTTFWDMLLEPVFGRRLVYSAFALVVLMSGYLVLSPVDQQQFAAAPERLLVSPHPDEPSAVGFDPQRDRNVVLVDMVSFSQAQ